MFQAISCHYAAAESHFINVKGTIQENIAKEVEDIASKKYGKGIKIPFDFIWRIRSRLVIGCETDDGEF
jgi:phytanoyl-CoA hydroxylase